MKSQLGSVAGAYGGGVTDEWMRSSEKHISNARSRIDTLMNEITDLRQKQRNHDQSLASLEGTVMTHRELSVASKHASSPILPLPEDISRRLTNAENASDNIEFLISETSRQLNDIKHEVKKERQGTVHVSDVALLNFNLFLGFYASAIYNNNFSQYVITFR